MNTTKNAGNPKNFSTIVMKMFEYFILFMFQLLITIIHTIIILAESITNAKLTLEKSYEKNNEIIRKRKFKNHAATN